MRQHIRRFYRDERGMSFVYVSIGFMAFMAATTLAIDVGMAMTARAQAQNAADAGALAGAAGLAFNSYTDRSSTGPAVQSAVSTARANVVMGGSQDDIDNMVGPADVTFPNDPSGEPNRVQVVVHRTAASNNAVPTLIAGLFGVPTLDIAAVAVAEVSPANAMTCVKPFMIPDKWQDNTPTQDNFQLGTDVYIGADQPGYTGYTVQNDVGSLMVLRAGTGTNVNPSFYFSWRMDGGSGASWYEENIATCNSDYVTWGEPMTQEPGNMVGPTIHGIQDLIDQDPNATWDAACVCVTGSTATGQSPRVFPIPLYDPQYYAEGQSTGIPARFRVANFLGYFVESVQGNQIYGRITTVIGVVDDTAGPMPSNGFPLAIRLIE